RRMHAVPSSRTLVAAFAAVAVSFVLATVASEYSDVEIRRSARGITGNAAPSIVHMEAFRSEARHLIVLADDYIDQSVDVVMADPKTISRAPAARQQVQDSLARLEREWQAYQALPVFPGERALGAEVARAKATLSRQIGEALAAVEAGRPLLALDVLERQAKPSGEELDDVVVKVIELDAGYTRRLGSKIDGLGRHSITLAIALDGVSVALTVLTAFLVLRVIRRYTNMTEQRAAEL